MSIRSIVTRAVGTILVAGLVLGSSGCLGSTPRQSGVFITRDAGVNWDATPDLKNKKTKVPKVYPPLEVTAVGSSPVDSQRVVAGTEENLYRSGDSGKTWELLTKKFPTTKQAVSIQAIAFHPTEKDTFYVGGVSAGYGKVYKTIDGGNSFRDAFTVSRPSQAITAVLIDPNNGEALYVGDQLGSVYKSADGATTWRRAVSLAGPVTSLAASGGSFYAATAGAGIFRSTDEGSSFNPVNGNLTSDQQKVWSLAAGLGALYAGTEHGLLVTRDFGATWQPAGNPLPPNGQRVQAIAVSSSYVYFATNAVVYQLTPAGDSFVPVQLKLAQSVFSLVASKSDTTLLYAGANAKANFGDRLNRGIPQLVKPL